MKTKKDPALSDLRHAILGCAMTLLKLIDSYTKLMKEKAGIENTTIAMARPDAENLVNAAFNENVNPDNEPVDEEDYENVTKALRALGLKAN